MSGTSSCSDPASTSRRITLKDAKFFDDADREVVFRGINFAADAKNPTSSSPRSYVGSPCSLEEADEHFARLRLLGFNCIRWLYTWDALQPLSPNEYDEAYIDYSIAMLRKAVDHGFYIILDPHQDIWSRYSGGSGAPEWTLHAAGFDPRYFNETHAALLWDPEAKQEVKMLWASNYHRLVCLTMFTLFFGGEQYAPKAKLNGVNVGAYLENKFFEAVRHYLERIHEADLGYQILGAESYNEPGHGLIGWAHLDRHPLHRHHVKLGTAPTPYEGMLLGQGIDLTTETFKFSHFGLKQGYDEHIHPSRGTWLLPEDLAEIDKRYGWERSWPGGCIWELHDIYSSSERRLLKPDYFQLADTDGYKGFVDDFFVRHWDKFVDLVKGVNPDWFRFMQAPVNFPPPNMEGRPVDPTRTVYTPHYYDGMTLMLKRWRWLNVDAIGVMRELYTWPGYAVRLGNRRIRRSFVTQLRFLKDEGQVLVGKDVPILMSEIGIPYDMDNRRAYTTGYWDGQIRAMDANCFGLEENAMSHCLWCYSVHNTHRTGDNFAGEDLSIFSCDDMSPDLRNQHIDGIRGAPAVVRPTPIAIAGIIKWYLFDIYRSQFRIQIDAPAPGVSEIFLPEYHFPDNHTDVKVAGEGADWARMGQVLEWKHGAGLQYLRIKGVPRFSDSLYSYIEPVQKLFDALKSGIW